MWWNACPSRNRRYQIARGGRPPSPFAGSCRRRWCTLQVTGALCKPPAPQARPGEIEAFMQRNRQLHPDWLRADRDRRVPSAAHLPYRQRRRPRVRDGDGPGRQAGDHVEARELRGARRWQAAAADAVRQQPAADPPHRHARRVGQHAGQPAAAARRQQAAVLAPAARRPGARRRFRQRGGARPRVHAQSRRARTIAADDDRAQRADAAVARDHRGARRLRRERRQAKRGAGAERRQGQRADRVPAAAEQPGRGDRPRPRAGRDDLRRRPAQPQPGTAPAAAPAACRR